MNGPMRKLAAVLFAAFALLVVDVTYLQVVAAPSLRNDPRNTRGLISRAGAERGPIIAADEGGTVLAESQVSSRDAQRFDRSYPFDALYAHTVGYSSLLFGTDGVEGTRAEDLRSKRNLTISDLIGALLGRDLRPRGVRLTLQPEVQQAAQEALGDQAGAVIALDPTTGEVLALVSSPSFDPNDVVDASAAEFELLQADPAEPLLDRITSESYAPGSTFKVVVTAAAIENGVAAPDSTFPDDAELELPGTVEVIRNFDGGTCAGGGEVSLRTAFVLSCNTVFGRLAMDVGADLIFERAEAFGFGQDIPFEWDVLDSVFPSPDSFTDDLPALAQSGIGQRNVQATPLQMALVAAAVANDGLIMEPYLVSQVFDADSAVVEEHTPEIFRRAISPATADVLDQMMRGVVESGTGTRAAVSGVEVGGKTGTAEMPSGPPHVWFIGFARDGEAALALAVVVESGGEAGDDATGGSVAAPIARQVIERWREAQ